ncbi:hypothetical protein TRVA0_009S00936 [Trichomonascus vanleenenianus]|uniref:Utp8p n=1 Tax=Trichomonascus vanleenenianus TaxID=2268995 RepID=UPI003EC974E3
MPSISAPFTLLELPQSSSKVTHSPKIACSRSSVFLGISTSSVCAYTLQSPPQLIWSHSISPVSKITAIAASDDGSVYYATVERKKFYLYRISTESDEPRSSSVETDKEVCKISVSQGHVYVVFKSCEVRCYAGDFGEGPEPLWTTESDKGDSQVYTTFISERDLGTETAPEGGAVLIVSSRPKSEDLNLRVVALTPFKGYDLSRVQIPIEASKSGKVSPAFTYGDGLLYRFLGTSLEMFSPLDGSQVASMKIPFTNADSPNPTIVSLGKRKILVSSGHSEVLLIDTSFQTLLATEELDSKQLELVMYASTAKLAIGVTSAAKSASVVALAVDSGKGTLLESLGRGFEEEGEPGWRFALSDIVIKKNYGLKEYNKVLGDIYTTSATLAMDVLDDLRELREKKDEKTFEVKLVKYLKGENWDEIGDGELESVVYEADKDREVDREFIVEVVDMIFDDSKPLEFVPENAVIYLLTHPLFPSPEIEDLLGSLASRPRLLRQAVVTAPTLSCVDLVSTLSNPSDEIFGDVVNRIVEEYGQEAIVDAVKRVYSDVSEINRIVNRLAQLNVGWTIVSSFIDVGGLFAWDQEVVSSLSEQVNSQVEALEASSEIMALIDEVIRKVDPETDPTAVSNLSKRELKKLSKEKKKKHSKKSATTEPEVISAEQREREKVQGLLAFGTGESQRELQQQQELSARAKKKNMLRHANSISRRVPVYSVEKLVL